MRRRPDKPVDLDRVRRTDADLEALRARDPEAFDAAVNRAAGMGWGEAVGPHLTEKKRMAQTPVNLRLPPAMIERADELVPRVQKTSELATAVTVTRSDVLRLAILRGLQQLETELGEAQGRLPLDEG